MPFRYRLKKILELRERNLKKQELRVQQAEKALQEVEAKIEAKRHELLSIYQNKQTAHHTMFALHDHYAVKLNDELDMLADERRMAKARLENEQALLRKAQADLDAILKHQEKSRELWQEEEDQLEAKMLDEIGGQRYFRTQVAQAFEED